MQRSDTRALTKDKWKAFDWHAEDTIRGTKKTTMAKTWHKNNFGSHVTQIIAKDIIDSKGEAHIVNFVPTSHLGMHFAQKCV